MAEFGGHSLNAKVFNFLEKAGGGGGRGARLNRVNKITQIPD